MAVDEVASAELVTPHHILTMHRMLMDRSPSPEVGGGSCAIDRTGSAARTRIPAPRSPSRLRRSSWSTCRNLSAPQSETIHPFADGNGQPCLHHGIERLPIRRPTWLACRARSDAQMDRGIPRGHGARCGRCGSARTGSRRTRGSLAIGGVAASRKRRRPRYSADHYSSRRDG